MLQELIDALQAPKKFLWSMVPGLHDPNTGEAYSGAQVAQNAFGTDPQSVWGKALGFGLDVAGDPLNLIAPMAVRGVGALGRGLGLLGEGAGAAAQGAGAVAQGAGTAADVAGATAQGAGAAADAATNAFNPAMRGLRNTFGMVKGWQDVPDELLASAGDMASSGTLPRRMVMDPTATMFGETTGPIHRGFLGDVLSEAADPLASADVGGGFYGITGGGPGDVTGIGYSTDPISNRHELIHGLVNAAAETGNMSGLPLSVRVPATMYRYAGETGPMRALGSIFDEAAAHAAEARGASALNRLGTYADFLAYPHPGYLEQTAARSPLIAALHQNVPYVLPAGIAGGTYLAARPFFND